MATTADLSSILANTPNIDPSQILKDQYDKLNNFTSNYSSGLNSLVSSQNAAEQAAAQKYADIANGQTPLTQVYNNLADSTGYNQAVKNYYSTQGLISKLPQDMQDLTTGTMTSSAQRDRQTAAQLTPLNNTLANFNTQMQITGNNLNAQMNNTQADYTRQLNAQQALVTAQNDQAARAMTGFTTSHQAELTGLLQLMSEGTTLSSDQYNRLTTLANTEQQYQNTLNLLPIQQANAVQLANISGKYQVSAAGAGNSGPSIAQGNRDVEAMQEAYQKSLQQKGASIVGQTLGVTAPSGSTANPMDLGTLNNILSGKK